MGRTSIRSTTSYTKRKRSKRICPRGKACPYIHEHQHVGEFDHVDTPQKKTSNRGRGRKLGHAKSGRTVFNVRGVNTTNNPMLDAALRRQLEDGGVTQQVPSSNKTNKKSTPKKTPDIISID